MVRSLQRLASFKVTIHSPVSEILNSSEHIKLIWRNSIFYTWDSRSSFRRTRTRANPGSKPRSKIDLFCRLEQRDLITRAPSRGALRRRPRIQEGRSFDIGCESLRFKNQIKLQRTYHITIKLSGAADDFTASAPLKFPASTQAPGSALIFFSSNDRNIPFEV